MSANTRNRIRLYGDPGHPYRQPINAVSKASAVFPRARAVRVDFALYDGGVFQPSIVQFDSLTLELMPASGITGARLVSKTVSSADFANGISENGWTGGTEQHAVFELDVSDTGVFIVGTNQIQELWLVISGASPDGNTTLLAGSVQAREDGGVYAGAGAPGAGNPAYYTVDQVNALIDGLRRSGVFINEEGTYRRILGVESDGRRIDRVEAI